MRATSMPASLARRRASGDANTRLRAMRCRPRAGAARRRRRPRAGLCAGAGGAAVGAWAGGACSFAAAGSRALAGRCRRGLHVLAFRRQHRDELVDRHVGGAFRHHDLGQHAVVDGLVFHRRLVGLDLGDHVAGLDLVAFLLEPARKVALLHRGRQRGHEDVDGHGMFDFALQLIALMLCRDRSGCPSRPRRSRGRARSPGPASSLLSVA